MEVMDGLIHFYAFGLVVLEADGEFAQTLCGELAPVHELALSVAAVTCLWCLADLSGPEDRLHEGTRPAPLSWIPKQTSESSAT